MGEPISVTLDAEDIRLAVLSYALPIARQWSGGASLRLSRVEIAEGTGGLAGELSAVVDWERTDDDNEGEADGPAVVAGG
jgi:hypothetical protein